MTTSLRFRLLKSQACKFANYMRRHGVKAALAAVRRQLTSPRSITSLLSKTDVLTFYRFILSEPWGEKAQLESVSTKTLNWIVPPFGFGSGGHLNIFRFISQLEARGFVCRIVLVGDSMPSSAEEAKKNINSWFFPVKASVYLGTEKVPAAHISVATSWITAYYLRGFEATNHKCYFVQDFEPCFYPSGSEYSWAEETYRFGFYGITAGSWLKNKLNQDYGMHCESFSFSYDAGMYRPTERRDPNVKHVFFYARPPTARRAFEMGLLVLQRVVLDNPDVRVIFAGWDVSSYEIPFPHLNAGTVRVDELPDLYSQCDVALVLSFSNLSLLPLELMACGTPVVSNRGACTEWLLNENICELADPTVEALAASVTRLLRDPVRHGALRTAGLDFANRTHWTNEVDKVVTIFEKISLCEVNTL